MAPFLEEDDEHTSDKPCRNRRSPTLDSQREEMHTGGPVTGGGWGLVERRRALTLARAASCFPEAWGASHWIKSPSPPPDSRCGIDALPLSPRLRQIDKFKIEYEKQGNRVIQADSVFGEWAFISISLGRNLTWYLGAESWMGAGGSCSAPTAYQRSALAATHSCLLEADMRRLGRVWNSRTGCAHNPARLRNTYTWLQPQGPQPLLLLHEGAPAEAEGRGQLDIFQVGRRRPRRRLHITCRGLSDRPCPECQGGMGSFFCVGCGC